jgi:hypothetical protein
MKDGLLPLCRVAEQSITPMMWPVNLASAATGVIPSNVIPHEQAVPNMPILATRLGDVAGLCAPAACSQESHNSTMVAQSAATTRS